ncbi:MAG TPA: aminotransferase class V-fold PLP-dependent enzyme [Acidimicrobiales bacterium]|nr:aminotransferase class V-fold PLP-dependent enzyme [Acidimicrobiales bacterium]
MQSRVRFPGLDEWVRLDGPAGTLPVDTCIEAIHTYLSSSAPANTGGPFDASVHTSALVEEVRESVGALFGARGEQVIFGPSATSLVFSFTRALARTWEGAGRIVCTQLDHDSNVTPWVLAARDAGASVTMLRVDPRDGTLDLADLERALRGGGVAWVALCGASNLTGWAPDLRAAVALVHDAGARLHVDAVARAPHLPVDVNGWGIDSLVTSPYKWYGPHAGVLVLQPALMHGVEPYRVRPAEYVGPERWESGTKSFEAIAGIGGAATFMRESPWPDVMASEQVLLERLEGGLRAIPGVVVHTPESAEGRAPTTIFNVERRDPDWVAAELAIRKIAVWSGDNYACELIDAMGLRDRGGAVRAGVVRYTTAADIDALLTAVRDLA